MSFERNNITDFIQSISKRIALTTLAIRKLDMELKEIKNRSGNIIDLAHIKLQEKYTLQKDIAFYEYIARKSMKYNDYRKKSW